MRLNGVSSEYKHTPLAKYKLEYVPPIALFDTIVDLRIFTGKRS